MTVENIRDFDLLDLLIVGMVAETGEPDEVAWQWVEQAMATARKARLANGGGDAGEVV